MGRLGIYMWLFLCLFAFFLLLFVCQGLVNGISEQEVQVRYTDNRLGF